MTTERIEGYEVEGCRYVLCARDGELVCFVQRSTMRGRPWLRFLRRLDGQGFWIRAFRSLCEARR